MENLLYKDFGWKDFKSHAHDYLYPVIKQIVTKYNFPESWNVLDAGCGSGYILSNLKKNGFGNVYGFDLSEKGIQIAKENNKDISDNIFLHNCYEDLLLNIRFDLVISSEVIEHLYTPELYIKNINLWLKDHGYLIITTPYHGYLKNLAIALLNKGDHHYDVSSHGGHIKFYSRKTLVKLLEDNNFEIIDFCGAGRFPLLWKSMVILAKNK